MFIIWQKQEQFNSLNETGSHELTFLLANDDDNDELKMNYLPSAVFIAELRRPKVVKRSPIPI